MAFTSVAARAAALAALAGIALSPVAASASAAARPHRSVPITLPLSYAPADTSWQASDDTANAHRWRRYRHHDGIDGGDLLAGLLVIGGIAAVASAVDKNKQDRRGDRTDGRDYPYREGPYDYRSRDGDRDRDDDFDRDDDRSYGRGPARGYDAGSADRAVDACSAQAARTGRVDEIYDVARVGNEWRVKGDFANGREFTCTVDASGRAYVGLDRQSAADAAEPEPVARVGRDGDDDDRYATGRSGDFEDPRGR